MKRNALYLVRAVCFVTVLTIPVVNTHADSISKKAALQIKSCLLKERSPIRREAFVANIKKLSIKNNVALTSSCNIEKTSKLNIKSSSIVINSTALKNRKDSEKQFTGVASACIANLIGDTNHDLSVNITDLTNVSRNYGKLRSQSTPPESDLTNDGQVGFPDLLLVAQNFGKIGCPATPEFKVFDTIGGYAGRPSPFLPNVTRATVDGYSFYRRVGGVADYTVGDEAATRAFARSLPEGQVLSIDIEDTVNFPTDIRSASRQRVDQTIQKFKDIIHWLKDEKPSLIVGLYSLFPISDYTTYTRIRAIQAMIDAGPSDPMYYWALGSKPGALAALESLQQADDALLPLAQAVDVFMPSVYMAEESIVGFDYFVAGTMEEARRHNTGKKTYPFVWPRCHQSGACAGQFFSGAAMQAAYRSLKYHGADGAMIWDNNSVTVPWQQFPWLTELSRFLASVGQ